MKEAQQNLGPSSSGSTPTPTPKTVVIFGATGQVGTGLCRALRARGHVVLAVSRTGTAVRPLSDGRDAGFTMITADLADPARAGAIAAGADLVFHVAGAPYRAWSEALPAAMLGAIAAARAADAPLVYLDNLYCYGEGDGSLRPDTPIRPVGRLGRVRARLAAELTASGVASVVVRVSDFYGVGSVRSTPGALVVDRIRAGRTGQWPVSLDQPHSLHYLPDVVRGLAELGPDPRAVGRVWHLPAAEPLTGGDFVRATARAFGRPERAAVLTAPMLRLAGLVNADARDLAGLGYQYRQPWVIDGSATVATFGFTPTPHREALAEIAAASPEKSGR